MNCSVKTFLKKERQPLKKSDSFVEYLAGQMEEAGTICHRAMFGGYAFYCDGKVVALVCNDELFVKPTDAGRKFIGTVKEAPPYKGAKPYFAVQDRVDDKEFLSRLIRETAAALPPPNPKPVKKRASAKSRRT